MDAIAIVGMAGRFPRASSLERFWYNLKTGEECISFFSKEELLVEGLPQETIELSHFVPAYGYLEGIDLFDASLFGMSAREAAILDPQHRLFLECAWEALEDATYDSRRFDGLVSVYAGTSSSAYAVHLRSLLGKHPGLTELAIQLGNEKDFLATQAAYRLGLHGTCLTVQTACSTSLVAVHLACRALLDFDCDIAIAGGASVRMLSKSGYFYHEGGISSPDGHCRAFDQAASGTVGGDGVGVVVLRRLEDALKDSSPIRAIIRGSATNNDGGRKVGFTAPSVEGQAGVIAMAHAIAGVNPQSISYVETHGTGTRLGDPIEIAALSEVFCRGGFRRGTCAIGSVKTNVGHLDCAAGVAGLIKVVLALENEQLPPSLHYKAPNAEIDFHATPFFVNTHVRDWPRGDVPRRAGVSSFGIGGTNAHLVVEEAPEGRPRDARISHWKVVPLSAASPTSLEQLSQQVANRVERASEEDLADVAYTLQVGRTELEHRCVAIGTSSGDVTAELVQRAGARPIRGAARNTRGVAYSFPGTAATSARLGQLLYLRGGTYASEFDRCADTFLQFTGNDIKRLLLVTAGSEPSTLEPHLQHPYQFALGYALAKQYQEWGILAAATCGYGIGSITAAALAQVWSLDAAARIVVEVSRAHTLQRPVVSLGVACTEKVLRLLLGDEVWLASLHGGATCVVSGTEEAITELERTLAARGTRTWRTPTLQTYCPALAERATRMAVGQTTPAHPAIPVVSTSSGLWLSPVEVTQHSSWVHEPAQPLRVADAYALLTNSGYAILEMSAEGAGDLALESSSANIVRALPSLGSGHDEQLSVLRCISELWCQGVNVDWVKVNASEGQRRRVRLPRYPFARDRHWLDDSAVVSKRAERGAAISSQPPYASPVERAGGRSDRLGDYVAPTDEFERRVVELWEEHLGLSPVGMMDDFFELGGDSLVAISFVEGLKVLLPNIDVDSLYVAPTPRSLIALAFARQTPKADDDVVVVRADGTESPLFLIHDGAGSVLYASVLAPHIDSSIPILGLSDVGDAMGSGWTVEALGRHVADRIRKKQPSGPYRLAGWSFGGVVAYEAAANLLGMDEQVAFLGLLDSVLDTAVRDPQLKEDPSSDLEWKQSLLDYVHSLISEVDQGLQMKWDQLLKQSEDSTYSEAIAQAQALSLIPAWLTAERYVRSRRRMRELGAAYTQYVPRRLPIGVCLFKAVSAGMARPYNGWDRVLPAAAIRVYDVPGTHMSMFARENVQQLGELVTKGLRDAGELAPLGSPISYMPLIKRSRSSDILFCIPGAGATSACFAPIAMNLKSGSTVYGLEPRGLRQEAVPHAAVEAAASYYMRAMRTLGRIETIHLCGHSFGGWIAFELALQLHEEGVHVKSLTILDGDPPTDLGEKTGYTYREVFRRYVEITELSVGRELEISDSDLATRDEVAMLSLLHGRMVQAGVLSSRTDPTLLRGPLNVFAACLRTRYSPSGRYEGAAFLVLSTDPRVNETENAKAHSQMTFGWGRWLPSLQVLAAAGNHVTMLDDPQARSLAAQLDRIIAST